MSNKGWNGTFAGAPVPPDTYFWTLSYKIIGNEQVYTKKGDLVLLRS